MPKDYYRWDVRFSPENSKRLKLLLAETRERTGRSVSRSELLNALISEFFEKMALHSSDEVVHTEGQQERSSS